MEVMIVLDLMKIIVENIRYLNKSYILIYTDNKKANRNINKIKKVSLYSSNRGLIFSKIIELLRETKVVINFEYIKTRVLIDEDMNELGRN